ncbi:Gag-Pol polyprotein [Gossypium australe]|uniref:Gag-Pol polyprotein n=1 Tax=Gossypium australe TaxID=47621 RepID=A0A5B6UZY2_9ROSI|nr:Gag-Pol polyprotein [Gossypium australe]
MCKRFEDRLNEDIRLLVGILELEGFVVLVDRACKAEELGKKKDKVFVKEITGFVHYLNASIGYPNRDRRKQYSSSKAQATSVLSVGSVRNNKPEYQQCGRRHFGDCWMNSNNNKACFRCGSPKLFIRDCPQLSRKDNLQTSRPSNTVARGRPPQSARNMISSKGATKDSAVRSEVEHLPELTLFALAKIRHHQMLSLRYVRKGCDAYLAYILDMKVSKSKIEFVPVICEHLDVFLEELPGLPLIREVEFAIELIPGTSLISIAPYIIERLQEITDRGLARLSFSPRGAPILFVNKKDGSMRLCIDYH